MVDNCKGERRRDCSYHRYLGYRRSGQNLGAGSGGGLNVRSPDPTMSGCLKE
jgi:hypothetical protein